MTIPTREAKGGVMNIRKPYPSQKELLSRLVYDPNSGELWWSCHPGNKHQQQVAGSVHKTTGYRNVLFQGYQFKAHRMIWVMINGSLDASMDIDHINGNRSDNRLDNLRLVTSRENAQNRIKSTKNTSGTVGVHWHCVRKKWMARLSINDKDVHLGYFSEKEGAVDAVLNFKRENNYPERHGA